MSGSTVRRGLFVLVSMGIAVFAASAAPRKPPEFEIVVVPSLQTALGELPGFIPRDLSERGHVVGTARNVALGLTAAARFSEARGLEDLDPNGEYHSEGIGVGPGGTVLGGVLSPETLVSGDPFLYSDRGGFDFVENGKTGGHRTGFIPGFNVQQRLLDSDTIFGSVLTFGAKNTLVPYIYTPQEGWVDLSGLHPRFSAEQTFGAYINDAGYQVFVITGPPRPGEDPPTGVQQYFVRSPDGRVYEVVSPGRPVTPGSRPNRRGRIAGLYRDDDGGQRAYVWTPRGGLVDIHPEGAWESYAGHVTRRGAVVGGVTSASEVPAEIFVYTKRKGLEIVISQSDVEELVRTQGRRGKVERVSVTDINDRLEIVGYVEMRRGPEFSYYYSPKHGLVDLGAVVDDLDVGYRESGAGGLINNRGEILLTVSDGQRSTGAILRRVGGR